MGDKITISSATLINKCFELIEAKFLFNLDPEKLDILIQPQSIIHSLIELNDGSVEASIIKAKYDYSTFVWTWIADQMK